MWSFCGSWLCTRMVVQHKTLLCGVIPMWKKHKPDTTMTSVALWGGDGGLELQAQGQCSLKLYQRCFASELSKLSREQTGVYASACSHTVGDLEGQGERLPGSSVPLDSVPATYMLNFLFELHVCARARVCVRLCACASVRVHECHSTCLEVRGQLS